MRGQHFLETMARSEQDQVDESNTVRTRLMFMTPPGKNVNRVGKPSLRMNLDASRWALIVAARQMAQ